MSRRWELLDSGSVSEILKSKAHFERLVEFHWYYYSELAFQRRKIREQLNNSLRERQKPFQFPKWQRTVKYKYSLEPLSARGSVADPGGRFNVGKIDPTRYPVFSALYLASDKGTAFAEVLGRENVNGSLTPEELALTKPDSITAVSVSGNLESVIDIRHHNSLVGFVNLIKGFKLSSALLLKARKLQVDVNLVKSAKQLGGVLVETAWRNWPTLFDVPHPCQIFGSVVLDAGIEGILYESVITQRECLAVFPQNFLNSASYIALDDDIPDDKVIKRLDSNNFKNFI